DFHVTGVQTCALPIWRFLHHRQTLLIEEDFGELLGRIQIEGLAGLGVRFSFDLEQATPDLIALLGERAAVDEHAIPFHAEQRLEIGRASCRERVWSAE